MATSTLVDLVSIQVNNGGAGPLTLGPAASGFRGVEELTDALTYSYSVQQGGENETGTCVYLAGSGTVVRTVLKSSNGNGPINVKAGSVINFTVLSQDFAALEIGVVNALGTSTILAPSQAAVGGGLLGIMAAFAATIGTIGATLVGYASDATGAVAQTILGFIRLLAITPETFGAIGDYYLADGSVNPSPTNNTAALQKFLDALAVRRWGSIPPFGYGFTGQLVFPAVNNRRLTGASRYDSALVYYGGSTTIDLLAFGATSRDTRSWQIKNFTLTSTTQMTAGYALKAIRAIFCEFDIVFTGFYGLGSTGVRDYTGVPLWNGLYLDGSLYCTIKKADCKVRNNGYSACALSQGSAGIYFSGGNRICAGNIGVLAGGGANIFIDETDIIACGAAGFQADTSLASVGNAQMFFGPTFSVDQCGGPNIVLNDALPGFQHLQIANSWTASSLSHGMHVIAWGNDADPHGAGTITGEFGRNTNNGGDGVRIDTNDMTACMIGGLIDHNVGRGVNFTPTGIPQEFVNVRLASPSRIIFNAAGNISGVMDGYPQVTYRRSRVPFVTPASPAATFTVAHGLHAASPYDTFDAGQHLVRADAWYWSSSSFRVSLDVLYCDNLNITVSGTLPAGGNAEGSRNGYIDFEYSSDEALI